MTKSTAYPKRLIEVDLPIKRISAHARREKYLATITSLHMWWARRPLAACRAVICAALWPDPADENCPKSFRDTARRHMREWAKQHLGLLGPESYQRFVAVQKNPIKLDDDMELRQALLDFIADFANWDNATVTEYLATSRALTQAAHEALGGAPGTKPLVVDPFAGGGSIPLEALRVGAESFASDLNPVAVLLNRVFLEYVPKHGQRLAQEVRKWGEWVGKEAEKELSQFYPKDSDSRTPIAYLWARTIRCEGLGCGTEVPLMRSLSLAKRTGKPVSLRLLPRPKAKRIDLEIVSGARARGAQEGTVRRGSVSCPVCGWATPVSSVRRQLKKRRGGASDARLICVVTTRDDEQGRAYRLPSNHDDKAIGQAVAELKRRKRHHKGKLSLVPDEPTPQGGGSGAGRAFSQRNYGMDTFEDLFTPRQALALTTLSRLVGEVSKKFSRDEEGLATAVQTCLALAVSRASDHLNSGCSWNPSGEKMQHLYTRQALPIVWDFCESSPFGGSVGSWQSTFDCCVKGLEVTSFGNQTGNAQEAPAQKHTLPDDASHAFITDPPYYDAVPYADLSDFFYVWLKRAVPHWHSQKLTPKEDECIVDEVKGKDRKYFESTMQKAMAEGRRVLIPSGVGVVVFAHKSTSGWETLLGAMINAGWTITGSWPIDTELATRLRARNSAALASSIHLVCRPRENPDGSLRKDDVGDWRDVLAELPKRIHAWMPRLAQEGVVGADAIFACLGPALEVFSRYARVEKPGGETVTLKEYLVHVWAAISREALNMIFKGADATGFEEDARLTAMWLWTLSTKIEGGESSDEGEDEDSAGKGKKAGGYVLEYDAARKIAQRRETLGGRRTGPEERVGVLI